MALINGATIIEGNKDKTGGQDWPGTRLPVIPVVGDEIDINGEVDFRGMVRDAKDPQRLYNYQNTALAESLALAPKAPYVGYEGQFEGHEDKWRQANTRSYPYLEVKPLTIGGQAAPFPQRQTADQPIGAIVAAIGQADNDLKATMGLYEPSLGIREGAQSGRAIAALQRQGEMANSNFLDNMARSIRATGELLVELIPEFYDVPRVIRLLGEDKKDKMVMVHAGQAVDQAVMPEGVEGIYDLGVGRYDVTISVGPSHETKRQEAFAAMTQFIQAYPAAFPILGDVLVGNMDFPGSDLVSQRLKNIVPPEATAEDDQGAAIPPQVQQQLAQMSQQLEMMSQALKNAEDIIQNKKIEAATEAAMKREELASRERIAALNAQVQLMQTEFKVTSAETIQAMKAEMDQLKQVLSQAHDAAMADQNRAEDRIDSIVGRSFDAVDQDRVSANQPAAPGQAPAPLRGSQAAPAVLRPPPGKPGPKPAPPAVSPFGNTVEE